MKNKLYIIILIISSIIFNSCKGNMFYFNEETQQIISEGTYFGTLYFRGVDNDACFILKRKELKQDTLCFKHLQNYYIIDCIKKDTFLFLEIKANSIYEIEHRTVKDAASCKINLITDSVLNFHNVK